MKKREGINVLAFLKAVGHLNPLGGGIITKLAERFSIEPEMLCLLIKIAIDGGIYFEN